MLRAVTFDLRSLRTLTPHEQDVIQDAAARYAAFLGLEPRLVWQDPQV